MKQVILSVLGKDKPGIVASVTKSLYQEKINLEDVSMTILEGEFAMMMVLTLTEAKLKRAKEVVARVQKKQRLICQWTEVKHKLTRGEKHKRGTSTYVVSIFGKDKAGIVYKSTEILAKFKLNITDLNSKIIGTGKKCLYLMLLEIDIPMKFKMSRLENALKKVSKAMKFDFAINPADTIQG